MLRLQARSSIGCSLHEDSSATATCLQQCYGSLCLFASKARCIFPVAILGHRMQLLTAHLVL